MDKKIVEKLGRKLYFRAKNNTYRRYFVFRIRCAFHPKYIDEFLKYFDENSLRREILKASPAFIDQLTRQIFYKDSTWEERKNIIFHHVSTLEHLYKDDFLEILYVQGERITLWQGVYQEKPIKLQLWYHDGQRKEGCLSLVLSYEGKEIFQIMFWLNNDQNGNPSLYIGALQGPRNGSDIIKNLTKTFYGYRPKNLIFYGIRNVAHCFGAEKIYAVCNEGYYAMNHIRRDRKLKTDFSIFWKECEGQPTKDYRFYEIPIKEYRKSMEELKPSKRAQHRRRFALMDELKEEVIRTLSKYNK